MKTKWWHATLGFWFAVILVAVLSVVTAPLAAEAEAEDVDYSELGDAYLKLGKLEEALKWYERGLALEPEDVYLYVGKAQVLGVLGRLEEALAFYDRALALRPDDWVILLLKGHNLAGLGRPEEALKVYDRALKLYKDGCPSLQLSDADEEKTRRVLLVLIDERVKALRELGRFEEAADGFDLLFELEPDCGDAYRAKIEALKEFGTPERVLGTYDEALARYSAAGDLSRDKARDLCRGKAEFLMGLGRSEEAGQTLTRAAEIGLEDFDSFAVRGYEYVDRGEYAKAILYVDAALSLDPDHAGVLNQKGLALTLSGKYDDAIECYDRASALKADYADPWRLKGMTLLYLGEVEAALECLDRAFELNPELTEGLLLMGTAYFMQGSYAQARAAFEKSLALEGYIYVSFYLYLVDRAEGREGVERLRPLLESQDDTWSREIARFLAGETGADDLLAKAGADKSVLCEAHCYIGYKFKFDGDAAAARHHFEEAVATEVSRYLQYALALHELRRLGAARE